MMILNRRVKDRVKVSLLHGGSKIKVSLDHEAEWHLLRDRLDDAVANALASEKEAAELFKRSVPPVQLSMTCDLSHVTDEREFEECLTTIHRVMYRQHPDDVRLMVLVSPELRGRFDSVEWTHREACAASHQTTLALIGNAAQPMDTKGNATP